jgi:beta-galactosidase
VFSHVFDLRQGAFTKISLHDVNLITGKTEFDIWRAPPDNDMHVKSKWHEWGVEQAFPHIYDAQVLRESETDCEIAVKYYMGSHTQAPVLHGKALWVINADGTIRLSTEVSVAERMGLTDWFVKEEQPIFLPRFGLKLRLPDAERVTYLGYGPYESYEDKHRASYKGKFTQTVDEMFVDYYVPQENGARFGVTSVCVTNEHGVGLRFQGQEAFSFNASHYDSKQLTKARHPYELQKSEDTIVNVDYRQSGVGSNSCGPMLHRPYRLEERQFTFAVDIQPVFLEEEGL